VGGWKLDSEKEEDMLWLTMNPRVELTTDPVRRHRSSFTGGTTHNRVTRSYSPETKMLNTPVARTPPVFGTDERGASPRSLRKAMGAVAARPGSPIASGSSGSSKASVALTPRRV